MTNNIVDLLKEVGAILTGHFVGTSGRHMDTYITKDALFPHTEMVSEVGRMFAEKYKDVPIDAVVAPAVGGVILSTWTAYHLSKFKGKEVLSMFTEKTENNDQVLKRGYDKVVNGKNILVIEDTVTTGGSVKKTIDSVKKAGGKIVDLCLMVNRDPDLVNENSVGMKFSALGEYRAYSYDPDKCPLCERKIPINTEVGHGKKFLESLKNTSQAAK
ncbi:MAG: orotate phosphoribosyltransferase [Candidatus Liptonbacteria bacterium]|nr:orotate phosphoribosyltransferase [Candidatus Liptonbacteria bacterium]